MNKKIKIVLIILGLVLLLVGVIEGIVVGLNKKNYSAETNIINNNSNIISQEKQENQDNDFLYFEEFKNMEYYGSDGTDSCELKFDKNGKPSINIKYKNGSNETVDNFTNILVDVAAGSTYVTFDFKGSSSNGNTLFGNGTIKYSNISVESNITITLEYSTGIEKIFDVDRTLNNQNIISNEKTQQIIENKYGTTDISKIENLLKIKENYEYLKIKNIKEDNDKYLVEADYYVPTSITENEYSEMVKNKKIILNNKEYVFDNSNKVYSTEYGTVYIKGKPIESGYWIEKINGEYIFINEIGGVYNTINEIKENYLFYLDKNTKVSEIASDIEDVNLDKYLLKNKDLVEYFTTVIYNEDNNEIRVLVDKR